MIDADWVTPRRLPFALDASGGRLAFVELDEEAYRAASFLDERVLALSGPPSVTAWAAAAAAAQEMAADCDFIFHCGHVGSTLLARLLGVSERVFALREPGVLRSLGAQGAQAERSARLRPLLALLSRTWRPPQRSLVKATSYVAEIAPELMAASRAPRAILMLAVPQIHIAGVLGAVGARRDLEILSATRLARLAQRAGDRWVLESMSEGERAAMSWACELLALAATAERYPGQCLWVDFDRLLAHLGPGLERILVHLHGSSDPADLGAMMSSPDLGRYSKVPEHAYDAAVRAAMINDYSRRWWPEVQRGMQWLNRLAADFPPFAKAVRALDAATQT